jgi:hypothetical protein
MLPLLLLNRYVSSFKPLLCNTTDVIEVINEGGCGRKDV